MWYRSEVVIALNKKLLVDAILDIKPLPSDLAEADTSEWIDVNDTEDAMYYTLYDVKWYESYADVREITNYLSSLDTEDFGFVRTGEDSKDIEIQGDPYEYDIYPVNYIHTPFNN